MGAGAAFDLNPEMARLNLDLGHATFPKIVGTDPWIGGVITHGQFDARDLVPAFATLFVDGKYMVLQRIKIANPNGVR